MAHWQARGGVVASWVCARVEAVTDWTRRHIGRRGMVLLLLGLVDLAYGAGMILARPVTMRYAPTWWPASVGQLAGLPTHTWGWIWVGIGFFLFTGIPRTWRDDHGGRWQFAAEVALKSWWALAALLYWWKYKALGAWAPAATYVGVAVLVLIISGWPDSSRTRVVLDEPGESDELDTW